jgi:phosphatidylinositol glycan class N
MKITPTCRNGLLTFPRIDTNELFHRYDWFFLRSVISAGYLGWIAFSLNFILRTFVGGQDSRLGPLGAPRTRQPIANAAPAQEKQIVNILSVVVFAIFAIILTIKQSPALYYAYVAFPIFFWSRVVIDRRELISAIAKATQNHGWGKTIGSVLGYIVALEILVSVY